MRTILRGFGAGLFLGAAIVPAVLAQTPQGTAFTYQGRLTESGALPNGPYDLRFVLYDDAVGGTQVGPAVALEDVAVSEGLFTVVLDFGIVFAGEKRWLELGIRPGADTGAFTAILPRQELTPGPSALFSAAAADSQKLGGVAASQYVQTGDPRLSDARNPLPGSPDYVQNGTVPQAGVSFNVGGTGTADVLDATTEFDLGGVRILGNPGIHNLVAGVNAGASNTTGEANAFFGAESGAANTTGGSNTFFGYNSGHSTTTSHNNSFFGDAAGFLNTTGAGGSFFGFLAGANNTTASNNSFFGQFSGVGNTTGVDNSFYGDSAGASNTTGSANTFVGRQAGFFSTGNNNTFIGMVSGTGNTTGSNNTLLGFGANLGSGSLTFATAVGSGAFVALANSVVLGRSADTVRVPGLLNLSALGSAGATALCRNATGDVSTCSSSLRYKTDVAPFRDGLEVVERLQPIRFTWKASGQPDIGLAAEQVAEVEPLLAFRNGQGQIEGVNYSQLTAVLVNALKQQERRLERQERQIEALMTLVCPANPEAPACLAGRDR